MNFELDKAIAVLERTPATLRVLLTDLPREWVEENEGPDTWSPYDVLGHLIHGERTDWIPRVKIILEEGPDQPFDPFDRFAMFEESKGKSLEDLLEEFASLRRDRLSALRKLDLTAEDLDKQGTHPELGPVTLRELLATWVAHDLGHIAQISRVMAKQYATEVGPWSAHLAVLAPRR